MKKNVSLLIVTFMLISCLIPLTACGSTTGNLEHNSNQITLNDASTSTTNLDTPSNQENKDDPNGSVPSLTPSEGLEYILSEDETFYIVRGIGTCTDTTLVIPSTHNELPVKEIYNANSYMDGAFYLQKQLTDVIIPESITSIGKHSFLACDNLKTIVIGKNVVSIEDDAFRLCSNLTNIIVDENNNTYKVIDGNLYTKDATKLVQYAVGKPDIAFTIPQSVKSIGYGAFSGCRNLQKVEIPNTVTSIGYRAFSSCSNLQNITVPNSVTEIKNGIFAECSNLKTAIIGNGIDTISAQMFASCYSLESIEIKNNIFSIGPRAFEQCENLKNIYYIGTIEEWNNIEKHSEGNDRLSIISITCSDGIIE